MKFFNLIFHTSMIIATLGIYSTSHAQNFYKWVDKNGSTHYTLTPPPKNAKKQGRVFTINDTPRGSQYQPTTTNNTPENSATTTPQDSIYVNSMQNTLNNPAQEPTVPTTNKSTVVQGEHLALPPRIDDPTSGQYAPLR